MSATTTTPTLVEAQCLGKQGFTSHKPAVDIARKGSRAKETRVAAYRCPHCGLFHVGQSVLKRTQAGIGRGIKVLEKHS